MRGSTRPTNAPPSFPSILELAREAARSTEEEFAQRHAGHFLILERVIAPGAPAAPASPGPRAPVLDVLPVVKRDENNPFTSMITIGRARNNDIVVDDASVARMHAWIRRAGDTLDGATSTLTDGGSGSDTTVNGVPVRAETAALPPGARLRIGLVEFSFVDARLLHAALRAARAAA